MYGLRRLRTEEAVFPLSIADRYKPGLGCSRVEVSTSYDLNTSIAGVNPGMMKPVFRDSSVRLRDIDSRHQRKPAWQGNFFLRPVCSCGYPHRAAHGAPRGGRGGRISFFWCDDCRMRCDPINYSVSYAYNSFMFHGVLFLLHSSTHGNSRITVRIEKKKKLHRCFFWSWVIDKGVRGTLPRPPAAQARFGEVY
jgi:hypothetical protein